MITPVLIAVGRLARENVSIAPGTRPARILEGYLLRSSIASSCPSN